MPASRQFFLSSVRDYELTFFHTMPKVARPFARRKSFLYGFICLLWLFFGIFGRDAWKPHETLLVGVVADMVQGGQFLSLADVGLAGYPPLYPQLAALTAALTANWLPLHEGARLANICLLIGGFVCLWLAARRVYGIRTAWMALLLLTGCFGFMVRAHLLNFGVAAFFGMSLTLLAAAILTDESRHRSQIFISGCLIGVSASFLLLAYGAFSALVALTALAAAKKEQSAVFIIAAIFFIPAVLWAHGQEMIFFHIEMSRFQSLSVLAAAAGDTVRIAIWSLLPLLPLVLYGLWYTRGRYLTPLVYFMLFTVACGCVMFFLSGKNEHDYYFILPPLAVLAAHLLLKIPDGAANIMDSFAVSVIGVCVLSGLWVFWLILSWQLPRELMLQITQAFPGYALPPPHAVKVTLAALLTIGWIALLLNFGRNNERAVVNWSCGITLVWAVFNLLLVEYVDSGKSYRAPAQMLLRATAGECIEAPTNKHWRAQLSYYGVALGDHSCPYYLSHLSQSEGGVLYAARNEDDEGYYLHRRF